MMMGVSTIRVLSKPLLRYSVHGYVNDGIADGHVLASSLVTEGQEERQTSGSVLMILASEAVGSFEADIFEVVVE